MQKSSDLFSWLHEPGACRLWKYFKLLFEEPITSEDNIQYLKNKEKGKLKSYSNLEKIRTEKEVMYLLWKIHKQIALHLSRNEIFDFETELEKY